MRSVSPRRLLRRLDKPAQLFLALALVLGLTGCSVRKMAVRTLSNALVSGDANVFAVDDDPVLIQQALPFALKTLEALLDQDPENADLLLTTCSSYTQYTYAFVELEAERHASSDFRRSRRDRQRAVKLYLRARDYCLRALDLRRPGTSKDLLREPAATLAAFDADDVPLLFWAAGSWGSAISNGRHRTELLIDLHIVRAILERTLELDEDFGRGVLHDAMVSLAALPATMGGSYERAEFHYRRAVELNGGQRVGSHLNWAWLVTIGRQDREAFESTLKKALAIRVQNAAPADRLANAVNQEFARFLLDQIDDLFLDDLGDEPDPESLENELFDEEISPGGGDPGR